VSDRELQIKISLAKAQLAKDSADAARTVQKNLGGVSINDKGIQRLTEALESIGIASARSGRAVRGLQSDFDSLDALSKILGTNTKAAEDFATSLGMTADEAVAALAVIDELNNGNVAAADQYAMLRDELGMTEAQFAKLSAAAQRGNVGAVLGGNVQKVSALRNGFSMLLKVMLGFGAAAATFKLVDKYLEKTGRTWIDVGVAIGFSRDQLDLFAFDWKLGNTAFQKGVQGMKTRAQEFVQTLKNVGAAAKKVGGELLFGGKTGLAGLGELVERLSLGFGVFTLGKQAIKSFTGETEAATQKTQRFSGVLQGLAAGAAFAVINQVTEAIRGLGRAVVGFISDSLGVAQTNRQLSIALESVLGSAEKAGQGLAFVRDVVDRTGGNLANASQQYTQLSAAAQSAGVEQEIINALFAESSRVFGVFGLDANRANLAFTAMTQILSKGTLSMEELRGQLGEQLPIALGAVAEGLGITTAELIELTSQGKISGRDFAIAFTTGLKSVEGAVDSQLLAINGLQNSLRDMQGILGEALRPIQLAFTELAGKVLEAADLGGLFTPLIAAGEALRSAFNENPQIIAALAESLRALAAIVVGQVTGALQGFADWLENSPQQAQRATESFNQIIGVIDDAASTFGAIALAVGGSFVKAMQDLIPVVEVVAEVLGAIAQAVKVLIVDTGALEVVLKLLIAKFLIVQGFALAGVILNIAGAFGTLAFTVKVATSAMSLFGVSVSAAIPPLAAIAAALAAANFLKFVGDLRKANDELAAYTLGLTVSTEQGFQFANKLNNLNDAITEAGGKATKEQQEQLANYVRLSKDQISALEQQLGEVQNFEPKNDAQRQAQQNLIQQLQTTITSLNKQITEAEGNLAGAAAGVGTGIAEGFNAGVEGNPPPELQEPDPPDFTALDEIADKYRDLTTTLETEQANQTRALVEGGKSREEVEAKEREFLDRRIKLNEQRLGELRAIDQSALSPEDAAKVGQEILGVERTIASDRLKLAQDTRKAQEDAAAAAAKAEQDATRERIRNAEQSADELRRLQASGTLSPEDARKTAAQIAQIEADLAKEQTTLAEQTTRERERADQAAIQSAEDAAKARVEAEEEAARAAEEAHQERLRQVAEQMQTQEALARTELALAETRLASIGRVSEALERQQSILQAQGELAQAVFDLESSLNAAKAEQLNDILGDEEATTAQKRKAAQDLIRLTEQQFQAEKEQLEAKQALELQAFDLSQQQAALAEQRGIKEQELALKRLELQRLEIQNEIELAKLRGDDSAVQIGEAQLGLLAEQTAAQQDYIASLQEQAALSGELAEGQRAGLLAQQEGQDVALAQQQNRTAEGLQSQLADADLGRGIDRRADRLGSRADRALNAELRQARNALPGLESAGINPQVAAMAATPTTGMGAMLDPRQLAQPIVAELQALGGAINTLAASPRQLTVQTPDPVADTSAILSDITRMQTAGVNP